MPERTHVPPAAAIEGMERVGRFYAEIDPKAGAVDLFRVRDDGSIDRDEPMTSAIVFGYGAPQAQATCTGPSCSQANRVYLYTPGNVTYVEGGVCYRDGLTYPNATCGGLYALTDICAQDRMFCGPVRLNSQILQGGSVGALPNVVVDIDLVTPGSVDTCRDTAAGDLGTCQRSGGTNPAKVTGATSNLTPSIPGGAGANDASCAYCYGNAAQVTSSGISGARNAVISGSSAQLDSLQTNTVALHLPVSWNSSNAFDVTFDVLASRPTLEPAGVQLSLTNSGGGAISCIPYAVPAPNTYFMNHAGSGFGPPAACLAGGTLTSTCTSALAQAPDSRYRTSLFINNSAAAQTVVPTLWSDTAVRTPLPAGQYYGCSTGLTSPMGSVTTSTNAADNLRICGNLWRTWGSPAGAYAGAVATLGTDIIQVGYFGGTGTGRQVTRTPMPRCGAANPSTTTNVTAAAPPNIAMAEYFTAYAEYNDQLYIFGGYRAGGCTNYAARLTWNSTTGTGTWTPLLNLPLGLCGASAAVVTDSVTGLAKIVISGGAATWLNNYSPYVLVYDIRTNTYTGPFGVGGPVFRAQGSAASQGTFALFAGGYNNGSPANYVTRIAVANSVPQVTTVANLPFGSADERPGMAALNNITYYYSQNNGNRLVALPNGAGSWSLMASPLNGSPAWPYLFVTDFNETNHADLRRLLLVGANAFAQEYNP